MSSLENKWNNFYTKVENYCDENNKNLPTIIAVTKNRSLDEIEIAKDIGINHFGENYANEFNLKAINFKTSKWHFIGHLQRNKVKDVVPYAEAIHTLDSLKLANKLSDYDFKKSIFIQVNISNDPNKFGISPELNSIKKLHEHSTQLDLNIIGLMSICKFGLTYDTTYNQFSNLVKLGQYYNLNEYSIGMSSDWQAAISAGSTHIRIGSSIFG